MITTTATTWVRVNRHRRCPVCGHADWCLIADDGILKRFRQAVLAAACSGRLTAEWRETNDGQASVKELLASFKSRGVEVGLGDEGDRADEHEAPIPEGWARAALASLLREPLRNGHSAKQSSTGEGVRTLTLSAVTYGDFSLANTKVTTADPAKVAGLWIQPGDILIERSNTPELVGTARLYTGPADFAIFPDLLIRARVWPEVSPRFVELVLQSDPARRYFQRSAQGTAGSMPKIDQGVIGRLVVPLPPPAEQEEIVRRVEALFALADRVEARVAAATARAERLTQAVLAKAFRGELVPTEAELAAAEGRDYEPAEALLARIRAAREAATAQPKPRRASRAGGTGQT